LLYLLHVVVATTRQNGTCDMLTSAKLSVGYLVKIVDSGLDFYFCILIFFSFFFYFLFLEQLGLGLIGHAVTSVTT